MNKLFEKASDIIQAASATQLSLYVFCILVTSVLVVLLFQKAPLFVRIGAFLITLLLMTVAMVFATPPPELPPAEADWRVQTIDSTNVDATKFNEEIATVINQLKPKDLKSIKGFIRQNPEPAGDYKVVVFCNSTEGNRAPIKVNVAQQVLTHSENPEDFINTLKSNGGKVVVFGTYHGIQADSIFYAYQQVEPPQHR